MNRRATLLPVMLTLLSVICTGCSSKPSQRAKEYAANGGPEDPAILAVENLGGSCYRAQWVRETLVDRDRFWFKEVQGNPVVSICLDDCSSPGVLLKELSRLPHLQELCLTHTPMTDEDARALTSL